MNKSNLRIKRHFSIVPHSANQVELKSGVWNPTSYVLNDDSNTGKLFGILKELDGELSTYDIAKKHNVPRAEVEGILDHLQQLNVLETSASTALDYYIEQLHSPQIPTKEPKKILIIGDPAAADAVKQSCAGFDSAQVIETLYLDDPLIKKLKATDQWLFDGLALQEMVESFAWWKDYFIVLALSQNDPVLATHLNQINYVLGTNWIHGVIDGPFIFIGPSFITQPGPCYHCFEKRISMNLREYGSYQRYKEKLAVEAVHHNPANSITPVILNVFASHMAMEILNYQLTKTAFTKSKVLSIYLPTMEICFNEVLRLSGCQVCGAVAHRDDQQLYFDYQTLLEEAS